jgi:hypothetical protein
MGNLSTPLSRRAAAASAMQNAAHALSSAYAEFLSASAEIRALIPELVERVRVRGRARAQIPHAGPISDLERNTSAHQALAAGNREADDAERRVLEGLTAGFANGNVAETFGSEIAPALWTLLSAVPTHARSGHTNAPPSGTFARIVETQQGVRLRDLLIATMGAR